MAGDINSLNLLVLNKVMLLTYLKNVFLSLKFAFVEANSVDPVEMPHAAAFHLGLHRLLNYLFRVVSNLQGV